MTGNLLCRNLPKLNVKPEKTYTQSQVDKMLKAAFQQGWDARDRDIKKVVGEEVTKRMDEFFRKYDCHVLYILSGMGFGLVRLKRFFLEFYREHKRLKEHFEMDDPEYLPEKFITEKGVDLNAWYDEAENLYGRMA